MGFKWIVACHHTNSLSVSLLLPVSPFSPLLLRIVVAGLGFHRLVVCALFVLSFVVSALRRLKKPWHKSMEADDEEGRHRLVLEGEDEEKEEAESMEEEPVASGAEDGDTEGKLAENNEDSTTDFAKALASLKDSVKPKKDDGESPGAKRELENGNKESGGEPASKKVKKEGAGDDDSAKKAAEATAKAMLLVKQGDNSPKSSSGDSPVNGGTATGAKAKLEATKKEQNTPSKPKESKGASSFEKWKAKKAAKSKANSPARNNVNKSNAAVAPSQPANSTPKEAAVKPAERDANVDKPSANPVGSNASPFSNLSTLSGASAAMSIGRSSTRDEDDAAEALKAIMSLGQPRTPPPPPQPTPEVEAEGEAAVEAAEAETTEEESSVTKPTSPTKLVTKKALPTKKVREGSADVEMAPAINMPPGDISNKKAAKLAKKAQGGTVKKKKVANKEGKKVVVKSGEKTKVVKVKEGKKKVKAAVDKTRKPQALPEILMDLLNKNVAPDAIFWLPGQHVFAINKENFKKKVIPKYFNGKTFTSITKSLNLW